MSEWAVIWIVDGVYQVDWYDRRSDAIAQRKNLLGESAVRGAWLVHCPPAIVEVAESGAV